MRASSVAIPRKLKKPTTSVTVVRIMDDDCAGSWPNAVKIIGIIAPDSPAAIIEIIIDSMITRARPADWLQT